MVKIINHNKPYHKPVHDFHQFLHATFMWHSSWFSQGALGTESVRMACDASFGSTVGCAWDVPDAGGPELCWVGSNVLAECCERGFQCLHVMKLKLVMAEPKTSKNIWSIVTVPTPYDSYMILFAYIYTHNYTYTVCKLYVHAHAYFKYNYCV